MGGNDFFQIQRGAASEEKVLFKAGETHRQQTCISISVPSSYCVTNKAESVEKVTGSGARYPRAMITSTGCMNSIKGVYNTFQRF